jgi:hypothetical protein
VVDECLFNKKEIVSKEREERERHRRRASKRKKRKERKDICNRKEISC